MSEKMITFVSGEHFCIVDWHGVGGRFTRSDIPALISELQSLEGKPAEGSAPQTGEKRKRCGETGPRPFMVCGRWKGHEGHHRAMNDEYECGRGCHRALSCTRSSESGALLPTPCTERLRAAQAGLCVFSMDARGRIQRAAVFVWPGCATRRRARRRLATD
jgi:hypothetical protein